MQNWDKIFPDVGLYRGQCYGSKSAYRVRNPVSAFIPNAFVCSQEEKIWGGDLDLLTADASRLMEAARWSGLTLYVLRETYYTVDQSTIPGLAEAIVTEAGITLTTRMLSCLPEGHLAQIRVTRFTGKPSFRAGT